MIHRVMQARLLAFSLLFINLSAMATNTSELATRLLQLVKNRSEENYKKLHYPISTTVPCEEALHRQWDYLPFGYARRLKTAGLQVSRLNDNEQVILGRILQQVLGEAGQIKLNSARMLDQMIHDHPQYLLDERFKPEMYGYDKYEVAVFGSPGDAQWMLTFQGHHVYIAAPVVNNVLSTSTPLFFGEYPKISKLKLQEGPARTLAMLLQVRNASGVDAHAKPSAMLMRPANTSGQIPATTLAKAIPFSELQPAEVAVLNAFMESFLNSYPDSVKQAWWDRIEEIKKTQPETIRFQWEGSLTAGARHHFYLALGTSSDGQGAELVFEQENVSDAKGEHIHSVIWSTANFAGI